MDSINILMLTLDYPPYTYGGIATHVYNLCKQFKTMNCHVKVIVARFGRYVDVKESERTDKNITIINLNTEELNYGDVVNNVYNYNEFAFSYFNLVLFQKITKIIDEDKTKYDILHIHHGAKFAFVYSALKEKYGFKTVMTMHSMNSDHSQYIHGLRCWCLENSDAVITVSNYIKNEIYKRHLYYPKKIRTIYNGIDQKIHREPKKYEISFCGRLTKVKGCACLVRALKLIYNAVGANKIKTIIIGDGDLKAKMQKELSNYQDVVFTGNVKHETVMNILSQTKVNVIPSLVEAFGIIALESLSSSCITIASNQGGLAEIIQNNSNGFLFETNNEHELADKIQYALSEYPKLDYMIENGKETLNKFSWKTIAQKTFQVYKEVMLMS